MFLKNHHDNFFQRKKNHGGELKEKEKRGTVLKGGLKSLGHKILEKGKILQKAKGERKDRGTTRTSEKRRNGEKA